MSNHETVQPLTAREIFEFASAIIQQMPRDLNPEKVRKFLRDKSSLGEDIREISNQRVEVHGMVCVDRIMGGNYPIEYTPCYPEFSCIGPSEYHLGQISLLSQDIDLDVRRRADTCFEYLEKHGLLGSCLGLSDLEAIQRLGKIPFKRRFPSHLAGWKSVATNKYGFKFLPGLMEVRDGVELYWIKLEEVGNLGGLKVYGFS